MVEMEFRISKRTAPARRQAGSKSSTGGYTTSPAGCYPGRSETLSGCTAMHCEGQAGLALL